MRTSGERNDPQRAVPIRFAPYICFLFIIFSLSLTLYSFAEESFTVITSDSLEYLSNTGEYVAKGSVEIEQGDTRIKADTIVLHETTSEVVAEGEVRYEDGEIAIKAQRAELNIETDTGKLYEAEIFYKNDNYYISGKEIEQRGKHSYYSTDAAFTTCDPHLPDWCFKGEGVDAVLGERLKARDVSFRIKDVPVLYTPFLWAPLNTERKSGFLLPHVSYSSSRGINLNIPFFWAISENRDMSFVLDVYSKRGIGKGVEYRSIYPGEIKSYGWAYHIRDTELDKDFWEVRAIYENRTAGRLETFLNINYINEEEFYREFSPLVDVRTQRFLESTGEMNVSFTNSRLYFLSQYWIDLKNETDEVPQKLPEAGYVHHYEKVGDFHFSSNVHAAHLWRDEGVSSGRIDVYPRLLYSTGKDFVFSQTAAIRGTAYSFHQDDAIIDDSLERFSFEYDINGHTRFSRRYTSFLHIIEPSVRFHYITNSEEDIPVFDETEMFGDMSTVEIGLLNRVFVQGSEIMTVRFVQPFDTEGGDRPFLPLRMGLGLRKPLPLKVDVSFDVHSGEFETINSQLGFRYSGVGVFIGQRYNREEDIQFYKTGVEFSPVKALKLAGKIWYDAENNATSDLRLSLTYLKKCWGVQIVYIKEPDDYTIQFMFELTGLFSNIKRF
jgi:LPS-assembly protein